MFNSLSVRGMTVKWSKKEKKGGNKKTETKVILEKRQTKNWK